ncbi:MAG: hypothetical protein EB084_21035 [Proteobacteria bacterium]|nr:hypothetical protein [Pseudomonadota bacterium]
MIQVKILDMTDNWEQQASLSDDVPLRVVFVDLLRQLGLPDRDPQGEKVSYGLAIDGQSGLLDPDRSLAQSGVRTGTRLRLLAAFTAR